MILSRGSAFSVHRKMMAFRCHAVVPEASHMPEPFGNFSNGRVYENTDFFYAMW